MHKLLAAAIAASLAAPAVAGPIVITGSEQPGYGETGFSAVSTDNRQIRAVGIYEAGSSGAGNPLRPFDAKVVVENQGGEDLYLVLSAYAPTNWIFSGAGLSSLKGVLFNGYSAQTYQGLNGGVAVTDKSGIGNYIVSCTYTYPGASGGGCAAPTALLQFAANLYGGPVDSFIGKYSANGLLVTGTAAPGVPEPRSWALMLLGFGAVGAGIRVQAKKRVPSAA